MVTLDIIQEQYAKMPDEELTRFAKNESANLTIDSFRLLMSELETRNIDTNILDIAETERALAELSTKSFAEEKIAVDFELSLLDYALSEKEKGRSDADIYNGIIQKGLDEEYAFMFVQSLNWKVRALIDEYDTRVIYGGVLTGIGLLSLVLVVNETFGPIYALYGGVLLVVGIILLVRNSSGKQRHQSILKIMEEEEEIIIEGDKESKESMN